MESGWTDMYAIMRDLSVAQGRKVPSRIVGSIGSTEKPPALDLKEETELGFFEDCTGELLDKPDFGLIKHMLDIVRDIEISSDLDNGDTEKTVEISKLNPCSEEFVPAENGGGDRNKEKVDQSCTVENACVDAVKPKKHRRHRNIALTSILESLDNKTLDEVRLKEKPDDSSSPKTNLKETYESTDNGNNTSHKEPIKLLKPNDFITNPDLTESIEKRERENDWPQSPQTSKKGPIAVLPTAMFKKKSIIPNNGHTYKRKEVNASTMEADLLKNQDSLYVPSSLADEYYQKYVERSKIQEQTKADIWERAERQMKEIDAKRMQQESALSPASTLNESSSSSEKQGMDSVRLSQHRHELPAECVVCRVLCSPGGPSPERSLSPSDTSTDKLDTDKPE